MAHPVRTAPAALADDAARPAVVDGDERRRAELARRLAQAPWEFDLFQAMRLIEATSPGRSRIGEARRPADEPVRFAQEATLAFAPADLGVLYADATPESVRFVRAGLQLYRDDSVATLSPRPDLDPIFPLTSALSAYLGVGVVSGVVDPDADTADSELSE